MFSSFFLLSILLLTHLFFWKRLFGLRLWVITRCQALCYCGEKNGPNRLAMVVNWLRIEKLWCVTESEEREGDHFKRNFANPHHNILGQNMWKSVTTEFFRVSLSSTIPYPILSRICSKLKILSIKIKFEQDSCTTQKNWCVEYFLEINWQTFDTHFHFVFVLLNIF